jgi:hypothetical protein
VGPDRGETWTQLKARGPVLEVGSEPRRGSLSDRILRPLRRSMSDRWDRASDHSPLRRRQQRPDGQVAAGVKRGQEMRHPKALAHQDALVLSRGSNAARWHRSPVLSVQRQTISYT